MEVSNVVGTSFTNLIAGMNHMVRIYQRSMNMTDSLTIIKYGSITLSDYLNTQKMSEEDLL